MSSQNTNNTFKSEKIILENSSGVGLELTPSNEMTSDIYFKYPPEVGTNGNFLVTTGAGNLTYTPTLLGYSTTVVKATNIPVSSDKVAVNSDQSAVVTNPYNYFIVRNGYPVLLALSNGIYLVIFIANVDNNTDSTSVAVEVFDSSDSIIAKTSTTLFTGANKFNQLYLRFLLNVTSTSEVYRFMKYTTVATGSRTINNNIMIINKLEDLSPGVNFGPRAAPASLTTSEAYLSGGSLPYPEATYVLGNLIYNGTYFGTADPKTQSISSLVFTSATNTTVSTGASQTNYVITVSDGFPAGDVGHSAFRRSDSLGNTLTIDYVTLDFVYHLTTGFTRTVSGDPVVETFTYTIIDTADLTSSSTIAITILPDTGDISYNIESYLLDSPTNQNGLTNIYLINSIVDEGGASGKRTYITLVGSVNYDSWASDLSLDKTKIYMLSTNGGNTTNNDGRFGYYDLVSSTYVEIGTPTISGTPVTNVEWTMMGFDTSGELYVVGQTGTRHIYHLNISTLVLTDLGTVDSGGNVSMTGGGITITDNNEFYLATNSNRHIYLLDNIPTGGVTNATDFFTSSGPITGLGYTSNNQILSCNNSSDSLDLVSSTGTLQGSYAFYLNGTNTAFNHGYGDFATRIININL
jgi:hypothetical protein